MEGMIMCGFSMEMELAEMCGVVGKCIGGNHLEGDYITDYCVKHNVIIPYKDLGCNDWFVDIR